MKQIIEIVIDPYRYGYVYLYLCHNDQVT